MLPDCNVIIVLLLIVCGCYVGTGHGKYMSQCEFVHEFMKYSPQISHDDLNKWTCIAHHQSNFDASKRNVDADGTFYHGLFQISDQFWCSRNPSEIRACNVPCYKLEDNYFGDDFQCAQTIYAEHFRIFGNGFSAWPAYSIYCATPKDYASECLDRKGLLKNKNRGYATTAAAKVNKDRTLERKMHKIYERCELARELFYVHNVPFEQVPIWVCIAKYESNFNTSAVGHMNGDGSGDHGLFQISDIYWCSPPGKGWVCGLSCAKLENADITDDVECMRKIYAEHQRLSGDGFNAWSVYPRCKQNANQFIEGCFDYDNVALASVPTPAIYAPLPEVKQTSKPIGKKYKRCELARELRFKHNLPRDQIHTWVCIAKHESSFDTKVVGRLNADGSGDHGLFQISDIYWCSVDGVPKACGVPCSKFEDSDISDDVQCVQRIFDEHQRLFGNGFHAWSVYEPHCKHQTVDYIRDCFEDESDVSNSINSSPEVGPSKTFYPQIAQKSSGKVYQRCELAQELRYKHNVPKDQIHTWLCIAQQLSGLDTSSVVSGSYGLFHISDQFWCSTQAAEKGCSMRCSELTDGDIADDVRCARTIYDEHQRLYGNGFHAWTPYETRCRYVTAQLTQDCFDDEPTSNVHKSVVPVKVSSVPNAGKGKVYERCELAKELRFKHNIPRDQIADWVCVALFQSNFVTSTVRQTEHGLFQISDAYWCSLWGSGKGCGLSCASLEDSDITDDVQCAQKIHSEHQRLTGNGFSAWSSYEPYCKGRSAQYIQNCFPDEIEPPSPPTQRIFPVTAKPSTAVVGKRKVYERCELARELRFKHNLPRDQIHTWVCIAKHESSFDTNVVGRLNADGSGDHGLFQISDIYWCSVDGVPKACGVLCSKFEDSDISDDVQCVQRIFDEHQRLFGNGFHAWSVYEPHCKHQTVEYIRDCFEDESDVSNSITPPAAPSQTNINLPKQEGKGYERCELANELRYKHKVPVDEIADWVCISLYSANLVTSARGQREHGIFQISNEFWCSLGSAGKGCNVNCAKLEDNDISDDIACARKIHAEHQKISGNGFTAWATYEPYCRGRSAELVRSCFHDINLAAKTTTTRPTVTLPPKRPMTEITRNAGKIYTRCDLARELRFVHNFPLDQIHTWVCIAQQQSQLNTSLITAPYAVGNRGFGIFQISEAFWCASDAAGANVCDLSCSQLLDDKLVDDVKCARKIYDEHQRLYGNGFQAWNSYESYCKYQNSGEIKECFAGNAGLPTADPPQPPIATVIAQSYSPKKNVKDRCTLAQELRLKQNIAADKLSMWLCIAEHEPSFDVSNMIAMNKIYDLQQRLTGDGFQAWDAYTSKCKQQTRSSADDCFAATTRAPFATVSTTTNKPTTKSAAADLFDLYLNQYSTRKPQRYSIPTFAPITTPAPTKRFTTYKIPKFEPRTSTKTTKTTTTTTTTQKPNQSNDYFRNFINTQLTKLTGGFSDKQEVAVTLKPHITTLSPYAWASYTQKPSNSTTKRPVSTTQTPFQWNTTTRPTVTISTPHTFRYSFSGTKKPSLVTTTTTTSTLRPFTWKSTV